MQCHCVFKHPVEIVILIVGLDTEALELGPRVMNITFE